METNSVQGNIALGKFFKIHVTGNTVVDALLQTTEKIKSDTTLRDLLKEKFSFLDAQKKIILVTGHRRENFGESFKNICNALKELSQRDNFQIIYPVHVIRETTA